MDAAGKADLLGRLEKMQSVGATILSNATLAKKLAETIDVTTEPAPESDPAPEPEPEPVEPSPDPEPQPVAGFPSPETTGVPAGTTLAPAGPQQVLTDGAVIEGLHVTGDIEVLANNVTIRKTRVTGGRINQPHGFSGLVVEDVEMDGQGYSSNWAAVSAGNYTLRRVNIHGFAEGPRIEAGPVLIEDSLILIDHDEVAQGAHQDCIQSTGAYGITIRRNTLLNAVDGGNAAIMLGSYQGGDVLIEGNLVGGGGYTVYGGDSNDWTNVVLGDNQWTTRYYPRGGYHGPLTYAERATKSGNVWADGPNAGQPI